MYIVAVDITSAESDHVIAVQKPNQSLDDMRAIAIERSASIYEMLSSGELIEVRFCSECGFIGCECGDTADIAEYGIDAGDQSDRK